MEPTDLLLIVADVLKGLNVSYLTVGSMASIAYGEPRLTNDIDIVADLRLELVDSLCTSFPAPDYYCFRESVVQAVRERFQFNIIGIMKVQGERVDRNYIADWAARLNLSETWHDVLALV